MSAFSRSPNSYLSEALALDMDLYERTRDQPRRKDHGSLVEETPTVALLKLVVELLQQVAQYSANAAGGLGVKGKAKVKALPRPVTARDKWERHEARRAFEHLESVIRFVPPEEFDRKIAESGGG